MRRLVYFLLFSLAALGSAAQDTYSEANLKAADPIAGEQSWQQYCAFCHTAGEGQAGMAGPNLYKLFQRKVGSKEGFAYSDALKNDGRDWTPGLDRLPRALSSTLREVRPGGRSPQRLAAADVTR